MLFHKIIYQFHKPPSPHPPARIPGPPVVPPPPATPGRQEGHGRPEGQEGGVLQQSWWGEVTWMDPWTVGNR